MMKKLILILAILALTGCNTRYTRVMTVTNKLTYMTEEGQVYYLFQRVTVGRVKIQVSQEVFEGVELGKEYILVGEAPFFSNWVYKGYSPTGDIE